MDNILCFKTYEAAEKAVFEQAAYHNNYYRIVEYAGVYKLVRQ